LGLNASLLPDAAGANVLPIQGLGPQDALLVTGPSGEIVFSHNPDRPMVPASTLKVLTSLAALHILGQDYRFPTDFYLDADHNLIIKGYGDPLLISEVIAPLAQALAEQLPGGIRDILVDESYFAEPLAIPGVSTSSNPYDAPNGALCVNFNTVFFTRIDGRFQSAEPQTPLLPLVIDRIRRSGLREGRIVLSRSGREAQRYAGQLFRHFLERAGAAVRGQVRVASGTTRDARLLQRYVSPYDLPNVIQRLLAFSNNFTANQLLLAMGARQGGPPATLAKGVHALETFAREDLGLRSAVIAEGSGISRNNRLSARDMMTVLDRFEPHCELMSREGREYYKTGHLKGVRTRVGYIAIGPQERYRFVLFRNRAGRTTGPVMRQIHRYIASER
jgi:D-alanyl-D-alanine carboxypeptidase/D-alanyl-D-alanine-endopeptidase (penicillin-binding protein 4)